MVSPPTSNARVLSAQRDLARLIAREFKVTMVQAYDHMARAFLGQHPAVQVKFHAQQAAQARAAAKAGRAA